MAETTQARKSGQALYYGTGRRKTSVARVRVVPGDGNITVNGKGYTDFFPRSTHQISVLAPMKLLGAEGRYDVHVKVEGGGPTGQAQAVQHGLSRALSEESHEARKELKDAGMLTRDERAVERKKYGLKKARKRPQFSKR
ncbi:30S ribosomal protein S9 [Rubrobacter aplysinae]|uniref:30S ribosomal protein S9 n=1 Tax=Rubrobacter aplysinae TaxID=909625 RepID=UPI00064BB1CA|nr:30S ribosomal protein S9 [Rubrobacter aplysinae]